MIYSVTERPEYKRCRLRWNFGSRNRMGLTKIVPNMALGLGTLVHKGLEEWAKQPDTDLVVHFHKHADRAVDAAKAAYRERVGTWPSDYEVGPLLDALVLGRSMMINYQAYWRQLMPDNFELIATEQRIQVAIPGTEHTEEWQYDPVLKVPVHVVFSEPQPHYLEGKLDMLMRNKKTGMLYVRDYKTYGSRPVEEDLFHDDQFLAYTWIAHQLDMGPVAGLAYDGLWKRAVVPKRVDNREGKISDLFTRIRIERPVDELIYFQKQLIVETLEMSSNPSIYMNRITWNGSCRWGCDYKEPCYALGRGEDYEHVLSRSFMPKAAPEDDEFDA